MPKNPSLANSAPSIRATEISPVRGISAWLAVVRTYQKCSEVLAAQTAPLGLKLAQHDVMMNLLIQQQQTQQQLAEKSFVTKSHMSSVLTEMVERGWLTRVESDIDKRSKLIALTPAGLKIAKQAYAAQATVVNAMMGSLSDKQIAALEQVSKDAVVSLNELTAKKTGLS
jgi:DNA-binding MarR family transcriptional regulator